MVFVLVRLLAAPQAFPCQNISEQEHWVMSAQHGNCLGLWCFHTDKTTGTCGFCTVPFVENWFIRADSLHTPCHPIKSLSCQKGSGCCFGWFIQDLCSTLSQGQENSLLCLDQMLLSSELCKIWDKTAQANRQGVLPPAPKCGHPNSKASAGQPQLHGEFSLSDSTICCARGLCHLRKGWVVFFIDTTGPVLRSTMDLCRAQAGMAGKC